MSRPPPRRRRCLVVFREVLRPDWLAVGGVEAEQIAHRAEGINVAAVHDRRRPRAGRVGDIRVGAVVGVGPDRLAVGRVHAHDALAAGLCARGRRVLRVRLAFHAVHDVQLAAGDGRPGVTRADRLAPDDGRTVLRERSDEVLFGPDRVPLWAEPLRPLLGDDRRREQRDGGGCRETDDRGAVRHDMTPDRCPIPARGTGDSGMKHQPVWPERKVGSTPITGGLGQCLAVAHDQSDQSPEARAAAVSSPLVTACARTASSSRPRRYWTAAYAIPATVPATQWPCSRPKETEETRNDTHVNRRGDTARKSAATSRRTRYPRNASSSASGATNTDPTTRHTTQATTAQSAAPASATRGSGRVAPPRAVRPNATHTTNTPTPASIAGQAPRPDNSEPARVSWRHAPLI